MTQKKKAGPLNGHAAPTPPTLPTDRELRRWRVAMKDGGAIIGYVTARWWFEARKQAEQRMGKPRDLIDVVQDSGEPIRIERETKP